ncbi:hypothetical protein MCOR14_011732 [Pyricularia oryzae]|nr:hypothetical protein MCOR13_011234 [Pyricularia oryzae]KAI6612322.1 hypothetical protein MCOR14_011732 [Pyricularia oryzae]
MLGAVIPQPLAERTVWKTMRDGLLFQPIAVAIENKTFRGNKKYGVFEYISLAVKGEFRVFLAPESSSKGAVFHWVHTAVNRESPKVKDVVLVTKPSGDDSVEFTANGTTEEQLKTFALYY